MFTNILLKVLEYGIIYGVKFLIESKNPKLGIGSQLATALVTAIAESKNNPTTDEMFSSVVEILEKGD